MHNVSIIKGLAYDDDWNCVKLFENYRSTTDIVEFANKHSTYADAKYRVSLHAQRDGVPVDTLSIYREKRGEKYPRNILSEAAVYCIDHEGTSAILCRTNAEVSEVTDFLEDNDVLYSTGKSNEDAIHLLKSVTDGSYMINWLASYLNADKYANFLRIEILEATEDETSLDKVKRFHEHFGYNPKIHKSIDDVFAIRKILTEDELPFIKCNKILELLDVKGVIVDTNATTAVEILNYLIEAIRDKASNDLYVGTIHSSKGLEYDTVVLLGVNGPSFHLSDEENKNLYYVGITRARTNLMVVEG